MSNEISEKKCGTFIISLDFELFWGVHDIFTKEEYKENILGAHHAVLAILQLFRTYKIHATWAVVGMLYFKNYQELRSHFPTLLPTYHDERLSAYHYMENNPIKDSDTDFFFAPKLIQQIYKTENQEIATHTFSHFYNLESGQTKEQFSADLDAALKISQKHGHQITSIIFPRNQINHHYLKTCLNKGIIAYRGNKQSPVYKIKSNEKRRYIKRGFRFLDRYINLFGHQTYPLPKLNDGFPINIRSSKFLIPYSRKLAFLENRRLNRIKKAMTYAAVNGEVYHLWWHPHNFGTYLNKNIQFLREILEHFIFLQKMYGFRSRNMYDIAIEVSKNIEDQNIQSKYIRK